MERAARHSKTVWLKMDLDDVFKEATKSCTNKDQNQRRSVNIALSLS